MTLKKIITFIILALIFYSIGSFINWELDVSLWGPRSRVIYILGAIITAFKLIIEDI
jgi:hypothetical protein